MALRERLRDEARLGVTLGLTRTLSWAHERRGDVVASLDAPRWRADPYPLYARARELGPLSRSRLGPRVTADHGVASAVLTDPRFRVTPVPASGFDRLGPQPRLPEGVVDPIRDSLLFLDPPQHTRLRRLAAPAFTPRVVAARRSRIERLAEDLLDRAEGRPDVDLIGEFAAPLPVAVISDLLGMPDDADQRQLARWGVMLASALGGVRSLRHGREVRAALVELTALMGRVLEARRRAPGDDVVSRVLEVQPADDPITDRDLTALCLLLLLAGFETTVNLIGNALLALARSGSWSRLVDDPDLAPAVVEETLRHDPPVQLTARFAHEGIELAGVRVQPGDVVLLLLAATGRDPAVFPDPDRFVLNRPNSRDHLAFAGGVHYCLGAGLARLEGDVALRALARRLPSLELAEPVVRRPSSVVRGPLRLINRSPVGR